MALETKFENIILMNIFRNERRLTLQNQISLPLFQNTIYQHFDVFDFTLPLSDGRVTETWKNSKIIFIVTPCINDIKHFIIQLMHKMWKRRIIKTY
jgi:hypothetical protein